MAGDRGLSCLRHYDALRTKIDMCLTLYLRVLTAKTHPQELTKSTNMDFFVIDTLIQLFITDSYNQIKFSKN